MKTTCLLIATCITLFTAVPTVRAEELDDFLKRTGLGNATKDDIHENFRAIVFVGEQSLEVDRDKFLQIQSQQKSMGAQPVLDSLTILSKTETPVSNGKGTLVSVVSKAAVTVKVGESTVNGASVSHDVLLRYPDGKFRVLFTAARQ